MITLDMFEDTPPYKLARKDDPETSKDAANEVSSGKLLTLVYEEVVKAGFDRLNELPEWYQYLVFLVCTSALGIKGIDKFRKK